MVVRVTRVVHLSLCHKAHNDGVDVARNDGLNAPLGYDFNIA